MIADAWRWQSQNPNGYRITDTVKKSIKQIPAKPLMGTNGSRINTSANASV
jgi:UDP-glucose 4-epimerase